MNASVRPQAPFSSVALAILLALSALGPALRAQVTCLPPPSGLVAWWAGEGNTLDSAGANQGSVLGNLTYATGEVGQAFNFDGTTTAIVVPASASLAVQDLTVEAWLFPTDVSTPRPIVEYSDPNANCTINFWYSISPGGIGRPGALYALFRDQNSSSAIEVGSAANLIPANQWSHVAVTFDSASSTATLYLNGTSIGTASSVTAIQPQTSVAVNLGYRPVSSHDLLAGYRHLGKLDEVSIYNRALSAAEIQAVYNAGSAGKCPSPNPPTIVNQPTNVELEVGDNASFYVTAGGAPPLSYQWTLNGLNVAGATASTLILNEVQLPQAGNYAVVVTNAYGSATSLDALLTVDPAPPSCTNPPTGLISWWRGDGNANDSVGPNNGVAFGAPGFVPGEVRRAFSFDGSSQYVQVADAPSLNPSGNLSIEGWFNLSVYSVSVVYLLSKDDEGANREYLMNVVPSGGQPVCRVHVGLPAAYTYVTGTNVIHTNTWTHVAEVYDGSSLKLYVNGNLDSTVAGTGAIKNTTIPIRIGRGVGGNFFPGLIDEMSLYGRALSAAEIQGIYNTGPGGKCHVSVPPFFLFQPTNTTVTLGSNATLLVNAVGSVPLTYQWSLNGAAIAGATNSALPMTNVQFARAGAYSVLVSNVAGMLSTSNATLNLVYPPAAVSVGTVTNVSPGTSVAVPVVIVANGNENAFGFSLNFDSTKLSYSGASLGSGAGGAVLFSNTSMLGSGKIGLALALPPGASLSPGTQQVVQVTFAVAVMTNAVSTTVSFGDQPTLRQLLDNQFSSLAATYTSGTIAIVGASFEGDLYPRPNGDKAINLTDWLQAGRYAARLDYPTNAAEFQRADCAPRATLGDGAIKVTDWVQVGRYAFGLDVWSLAGGPTNEIAGPGPTPSASRLLAAGTATLVPNQTATVSVSLASQGNENALGFSLSFDPARVRFAGATLGADGSGATLYVNTNQASSGQLGIALALGSGASFASGTRELARLSFVAAATASGSFSPGFGDLPVPREISDTTANALAVSFINGTLTNNPPPVLAITHAGQSVTLFWPLWASNFLLQQAVALAPGATWTNLAITPFTTNAQNAVTLPVTPAPKFYRLYHP